MLSKSQIKRINALGRKKFRKQDGLFVAEGVKVIEELLDSSFELDKLYHTDAVHFSVAGIVVTDQELKKISFLTTTQKAIAIFKIPEQSSKVVQKGLHVALDSVQDPGNLGTIIRLCDWYGITDLICSSDTVDCYNPKVVQATMGSLSRVQIHYVDLENTLQKDARPVYGTFMNGDNIYAKSELPSSGIIVMGNEGNGISPQIEALVTDRIAIPQFGNSQKTESLNVATATAIILSEFKRSLFTEK